MLIPQEIKISDCAFIDIETVAKTPNQQDLEVFKKYYLKEEVEDYQLYDKFLESCALYAELGEVSCVTIGYVIANDIITKSYVGNDELTILQDSMKSIHTISKNRKLIVAHNLKKFDHPFLVKRCSILGVRIPQCLESYGKKPWDYKNFIDTYDVWTCGQFGSKGSMAALCNAYGIPSPKDEGDGSDVGQWFRAGQFDKIGSYCGRDVEALARLFNAMNEDTIELNHTPKEMSIYNKLL
jgi:predicted PolB exonuclease-like 3'-5' exonuclease